MEPLELAEREREGGDERGGKGERRVEWGGAKRERSEVVIHVGFTF